MKFANTLRTLVAACTFAVTAQTGAAPILLVDSKGILTGAKNVDVAGTLYNVTFADGSCNSLFNGCVNSAFTFTNRTAARVAGRALLDQVFIDSPTNQFDTITTKIYGCTDWFACNTAIPVDHRWYGMGSDVAEIVDVRNFSENWVDAVNTWVYMEVSVDTTPEYNGYNGFSYAHRNWAIFEVASIDSEVPEPTSIALFGLAMVGLAFNRRRKV